MHHVMQFRVNIASQPLTCLFYATDSRGIAVRVIRARSSDVPENCCRIASPQFEKFICVARVRPDGSVCVARSSCESGTIASVFIYLFIFSPYVQASSAYLLLILFAAVVVRPAPSIRSTNEYLEQLNSVT